MVDHPRQPSPRHSPRQETSAPRQETSRIDDSEAGGERVAKMLARAGVASRREIERLIEAGRVAINGQVLTTPAVKVAPGDVLTVDDKVVEAAEATRVWRYNKPVGLLTSHSDPQGRPTVFQHLPAGMPRVISVGRLDINSEGLLLLTNDGGLARTLELPNSGWVRRYRARAYGHTSQEKLDTLKKGITVDGVAYGAIDAKLDKVQMKLDDKGGLSAPANVWITLSLTEGKNREVRRVLEAIGLKVNRLIRLAYGPFALGTLESGFVEEVGPRVIREQLAEVVAPQNMPKGERKVAAPASAAPHRRGPAQAHAGGPAGAERKAAAPEPKEKKLYKAGWAKPKPKPKVGPPGSKPKRRGPPKAP